MCDIQLIVHYYCLQLYSMMNVCFNLEGYIHKVFTGHVVLVNISNLYITIWYWKVRGIRTDLATVWLIHARLALILQETYYWNTFRLFQRTSFIHVAIVYCVWKPKVSPRSPVFINNTRWESWTVIVNLPPSETSCLSFLPCPIPLLPSATKGCLLVATLCCQEHR